MEHTSVKLKLTAILAQIQSDSGLECPKLTGALKPVGGIPQFDSKVWPVATTILASEIGSAIPDDINIFINEVSKLPRSIDEITVFVCDIIKKKESAAA